tara:strand:- start:194 stop:568 length:375 start_codon:yes stop_codon:yes gene_type:complete
VNLKEDKNWRLIKNLEKGKYCFLVSVKNWAIELTQDEFDSLSKLLIKIEKQMNFVKGELLEEECINLEIEKSPWYVELEGNKKEWNLKIIFESIDNTRSFEMYWPIPIAQTLLIEIIKMWESIH